MNCFFGRVKSDSVNLVAHASYSFRYSSFACIHLLTFSLWRRRGHSRWLLSLYALRQTARMLLPGYHQRRFSPANRWTIRSPTRSCAIFLPIDRLNMVSIPRLSALLVMAFNTYSLYTYSLYTYLGIPLQTTSSESHNYYNTSTSSLCLFMDLPRIGMKPLWHLFICKNSRRHRWPP